MRSITIDGEPVASSQDFSDTWNGIDWRADLHLPQLPPGRHLLKCEIESALVETGNLTGLAPDAPASDWPPALRRWTRSCQAEFTSYAKGAEMVSLVNDPNLDPGVGGWLSVKQLIIHRKANAATAALVFAMNGTLRVPVSFDVTLRLAGRDWKCGDLWREQSVAGKSPAEGSCELGTDIAPLPPDIREAEIILTPNRQLVEHIASIDRIWGGEIVFHHVALVRQDLR